MAKSEEKPSPLVLSLGNNACPSSLHLFFTTVNTLVHTHTDTIHPEFFDILLSIYCAGDTARNIEEMVQVRQMFQMRGIKSLRPGQISTAQRKNNVIKNKSRFARFTCTSCNICINCWCHFFFFNWASQCISSPSAYGDRKTCVLQWFIKPATSKCVSVESKNDKV